MTTPTILPCPFRVCGAPCRLATPDDVQHTVVCTRCTYRGYTVSTADARHNERETVELHNAMPRERPWTRVEEGLPEQRFDGQIFDIALSNRRVYQDATLDGDTRGKLAFYCCGDMDHYSADGAPDAHGNRVTHYREHVPPRHPEAE